MSINRLFRYITAALLFAGLPFGAFATNAAPLVPSPEFYQDKRNHKQERGKEGKKPEVKEVPQSRRQEKPGEVKQEKKEKPAQDNKRRN